MAWVAGADVIVGDLITAAVWNNYMGAAGSLEYLKTQTDLIDDITQTTPANADDTVYQNGTSFRLVCISAALDQNEDYEIYVENANPPTIKVGDLTNNATGDRIVVAITFMVPPLWFYEISTAAGVPTIQEWAEWDLH